MDPWYKVAMPRPEVREGRSFNPDEFAIALEQVVAGTAPKDYKDPLQFFNRTCFTRALKEHAGMVLRRLSGKTENAAPVLTLVTQFGGGKTHTLASLYHLVEHGKKVAAHDGVKDLVNKAGLTEIPNAKVAVFVGNAWDPQAGRETPWIDLARQLAGDAGVAALGPAAKTTPPGTETINRVIQAAGGSALILFDEVLNFLNRHRPMAEAFHAFIQNLTVAMTGTTRGAAMISLPRSQVEMTDWDKDWQDKITKVVKRVAKDLIANDETEISEVVRRRLFEDLGSEKVRKAVAKAYADWCFERRAQLPSEWTAVDTATTDAKSRDFLRSRFEACYPFHPATLSVFQRKWQALPQYQQTRGTLAMLAQWISWAYRDAYQRARREPLITLGSAPLEVSDFRGVILGQLGESRLLSAIQADLTDEHSHARALDVDTKGALRDLHRRVGTTILFESSGGQGDKAAHLPELRFVLGEPEIETTSIDNAAVAFEAKGYFVRKVGHDGFRFGFKPTLKKVVSDKRASLDDDEVRKAGLMVVRKEFERGATLPLVPFPEDGSAIQDTPRLTLVVLDPESEWHGDGTLRSTVAEWTKQRGKSPRLYPGSLIWCVRKPGRDLKDKLELWLAWKRVEKDLADGTLAGEFERADRSEVGSKVHDAEEITKDEVWASYRYVVLADHKEPDGLKVIDLGAGHASNSETLCGRVLTALKSQALLNESPGVSYLERKWPAAFKDSGAWPLVSLRQAFLNGSMERLLDPDSYLRRSIPEFVMRGDFGLASGQQPGGTYTRLWFEEMLPADEVAFDADVYLVLRSKGKALKAKAQPTDVIQPLPAEPETETPKPETPPPMPPGAKRTLHITGSIPAEVWNRLGTKLLPKLRSGSDLRLGLDFTVDLDADQVALFQTELRQVLQDLNLAQAVRIEIQ
ncbi:MAG: AAA family ATPase [Nitrospira sp. LK265]|nr:AAA family ATPase [Nitrospira sp. LK265]